ncbi:hypothetical protein D3C86_1414580 [compost metagenome]
MRRGAIAEWHEHSPLLLVRPACPLCQKDVEAHGSQYDCGPLIRIDHLPKTPVLCGELSSLGRIGIDMRGRRGRGKKWIARIEFDEKARVTL